jgi:hypothetical protein
MSEYDYKADDIVAPSPGRNMSIYLSNDTRLLLQKLSTIMDKSMSEIVDNAICKYFHSLDDGK